MKVSGCVACSYTTLLTLWNFLLWWLSFKLLDYFILYSLYFCIYIYIQILSNVMKNSSTAQSLQSLILRRLAMQWPVNKKPSQNMCVSDYVTLCPLSLLFFLSPVPTSSLLFSTTGRLQPFDSNWWWNRKLHWRPHSSPGWVCGNRYWFCTVWWLQH